MTVKAAHLVAATDFRQHGQPWVRSVSRALGRLVVRGHCGICFRRMQVLGSAAGIRAWLDGRLTLRQAFPGATGEDLEWLQTGYCAKCFESMDEEKGGTV